MMATGNPNELAAVLAELQRRTGKRFGVEGFEGRLRTQKALYLLHAAGHPIARPYRFNHYLRGPYSPTLARDYYSIASTGKAELERAHVRWDGRLAMVAEATERGNDFMEAVATLHFVLKNNPGASAKGIDQTFRTLKPRLADHIREAWAFLKEKGLAT